jgi:hypothetical protein
VIFVSYAWRDRSYALELCTRLEEDRVPYWLDSERLELRSSLGPQIVSAIDSASAFVIVYTRASRASRWVAFETAVACSREKYIVRLSNGVTALPTRARMAFAPAEASPLDAMPPLGSTALA